MIGAPGGALSIMSVTRWPSPSAIWRKRVLQRLGGTRIAVPIERHVGQAAIRRDGRRLPRRALERRHIGRWTLSWCPPQRCFRRASSWLMVLLRLFGPHRGTQNPRFPDPGHANERCRCQVSARFANIPQNWVSGSTPTGAPWLGSRPPEKQPSGGQRRGRRYPLRFDRDRLPDYWDRCQEESLPPRLPPSSRNEAPQRQQAAPPVAQTPVADCDELRSSQPCDA